jgi:hypothetical protein
MKQYNKIKRNIIKFFNVKIKMEKTIKLKKCTPEGKQSSNNNNMGKNEEFIITSTYECNKNNIKSVCGRNAGWVFDYEIDTPITLEELDAEKNSLKSKIDLIQTKIDWLSETGNSEFDEEQYKVYTTLKLLEKKDLSTLEKSKLIAELIKNS